MRVTQCVEKTFLKIAQVKSLTCSNFCSSFFFHRIVEIYVVVVLSSDYATSDNTVIFKSVNFHQNMLNASYAYAYMQEKNSKRVYPTLTHTEQTKKPRKKNYPSEKLIKSQNTHETSARLHILLFFFANY